MVSTRDSLVTDDSVDPDELNDKMASFAQDILELGALKANLPLFKQVSGK